MMNIHLSSFSPRTSSATLIPGARFLFVYIVLINSIYYSNKEAFSIEEPNGSKSNVALGSNTPVAPGRPYLVQINPTAAEEIGPASFDITVVREYLI